MQQTIKDCDGWLAADHALVGEHHDIVPLLSRPGKAAETPAIAKAEPPPALAARAYDDDENAYDDDDDGEDFDDDDVIDLSPTKQEPASQSSRLAKAILVRAIPHCIGCD